MGKSFLSFYKWSISNGYNDSSTIDRIDYKGDYKPSNCRWVTVARQNNNKRNNVWIKYKGKTKTLADWARHFNISRASLYSRIHDMKWPIEKAFTTPIIRQRSTRFSK